MNAGLYFKYMPQGMHIFVCARRRGWIDIAGRFLVGKFECLAGARSVIQIRLTSLCWDGSFVTLYMDDRVLQWYSTHILIIHEFVL